MTQDGFNEEPNGGGSLEIIRSVINEDKDEALGDTGGGSDRKGLGTNRSD